MSELPEDFQTAPLSEVDPAIAEVLDRELARQQSTPTSSRTREPRPTTPSTPP